MLSTSGDPYLRVNTASVSSAAPLHSCDCAHESESTSQHHHVAKFTCAGSESLMSFRSCNGNGAHLVSKKKKESSMGFPKKAHYWPEMVFWNWHFLVENIMTYYDDIRWQAVAFSTNLEHSVDWRLLDHSKQFPNCAWAGQNGQRRPALKNLLQLALFLKLKKPQILVTTNNTVLWGWHGQI